MTTGTTLYEHRVKAPLGSQGRRIQRRSISHSSSEESPFKSKDLGTLASMGSWTQSRAMRKGPEFEPITLTAYETGKRQYPRSRKASGSLSNTDESSSNDEESSSSSEDDSPRTITRSAGEQGSNRQGKLHTRVYLVFGLVAILLLGAGLYLVRNPSTSSASSSDASNVSNSSPSSATAVAHSSAAASSEISASSKLQDDSKSAESLTSKPTASLEKSASPETDSTSTPTATPAPSTSDSSQSSDNGSPPEYSGITLSGTFVDTASYAVATGKAATVSDDKANADMSKIDVEPNQDLVKDREGKIWVGDVTFYAAGKGGYGSCGTKLYDGQDIYFAAMSVYDLMGSASPAPFCYSCISLQSTKDPSKTITAVVSDSCPACTLAHVDLEQKAFFALGATVDMGVLTVAWSFVECPDGWSKEAMEQISESVYEEVKS